MTREEIEQLNEVEPYCFETDREEQWYRVGLQEGLNIGLVTDRGTPIISDPGYKIVEFVTRNGFNVISLPGPTAFVPALTMSGSNPAPFLFYGF